MSDDLKGTVFNGRYTILERIGAGGMATVYRARDEQSSEFVAVKILSREFLDRNPKEAERNLRRFKREADILKLLNGSKHVVGYVEHACSEGGDWFIAMELLEGEQLSRSIGRGKDAMPVHNFLHYGRHLVLGLKEIHARNIVHRDLAPDNLIIVKDEDGLPLPKFLDFGIGKSLDNELDQVTQMLTIMGKPQYFSPEQARGVELTAASDVYSIGVVLYQLVTGHVPLEIRGIPDFKKIQKEPPIPIHSYREGQRIPPELQDVIARCLAKAPEDRPLLDEVLSIIEAVRERANAGESFAPTGGDTGPTADYTAPVARIPTEMDLFEGAKVNRYEISRLLGRGGMGAVYEAWDPQLQRKVALKVASQIEEQRARNRLLKEARASAALRCENIVTIYDVGTDGGTPFIAMEFVDGKTLAQVIEEEGPLSGQRFWEVASGVCEGLHIAHDRPEPVVHRDLKPANVLIHRHVAKIADFGIAKVATEAGSASGTDTGGHDVGGGTAATMSPEQINEQPTDQRSDLYSLGCVLYMMATGRGPFRGNQIAIIYQHCNAEPTPPSKIVPGVPSELDRIILKLLEKSPDDRYSSAVEVLEDLRGVYAPSDIIPRPWYKSPLPVAACVAIIAAVITLAIALNADPGGGPPPSFGVNFVGAEGFSDGKTYYTNGSKLKLVGAGPTDGELVVSITPEGGQPQTIDPVTFSGTFEHEFDLAVEDGKATRFDVTARISGTEGDPSTFKLVHDPTDPEVFLITPGGQRRPLRNASTINVLHGEDPVIEIVDADSGFGHPESPKTTWRSGQETIEGIDVSSDGDTIQINVHSLAGGGMRTAHPIVKKLPKLASQVAKPWTASNTFDLDLAVECEAVDLAAHPLKTGALVAVLGTQKTPLEHVDGRYRGTLTMPTDEGPKTVTHTVALEYRGVDTGERIAVIHDPVKPSITMTYAPDGATAESYSLDALPSEPLKKLSGNRMSRLFTVKVQDSDQLADVAEVRYGAERYERSIGADGTITLRDDLPDLEQFDVVITVQDRCGNVSELPFQVLRVGTSVSSIVVNDRRPADGVLWVTDPDDLAAIITAKGVAPSAQLLIEIVDESGNRVGDPIPMTRSSDAFTAAGIDLGATDAKRTMRVLQRVGERNVAIADYAVAVDASKPDLEVAVHGKVVTLPGEITTALFPTLAIRASDRSGVLDASKGDLKIEGPSHDVAFKEFDDGTRHWVVTAPEGAIGTWTFSFQTRDHSGRTTETLALKVTVVRPVVYIARAGVIDAPERKPRQFVDRPPIPINESLIDLRIGKTTASGRIHLRAILQPGDKTIDLKNPLNDDAVAGARINDLEGAEGTIKLVWYERVENEAVSPGVTFDEIKWVRDGRDPEWDLFKDGVQVEMSHAELASRGLKVTQLDSVMLIIRDDCGFPDDPIISGKNTLPSHAPKEHLGGKVTWRFKPESNWSAKTVEMKVRDLAGREKSVRFSLFEALDDPQVAAVSNEHGQLSMADDTYVSRSGKVTVGLTNDAEDVVAVRVEVLDDTGAVISTNREPLTGSAGSTNLELTAGTFTVKLTTEQGSSGLKDAPFKTLRISVDTVKPTIAIAHAGSNINGTIEVERFAGFTARVSDDSGAIGSVSYAITPTGARPSYQPFSLTSGSGGFYVLPEGPGAGSYTLWVRATDAAGNPAEVDVAVTVKAAAPPPPTFSTAKIKRDFGIDVMKIPGTRTRPTLYVSTTEITRGQLNRIWASASPRVDEVLDGLRSDFNLRSSVAKLTTAKLAATHQYNQDSRGADDPVGYMQAGDALFFATAAGGRLPTVDEWKGIAGLYYMPGAKFIVVDRDGKLTSNDRTIARPPYGNYRVRSPVAATKASTGNRFGVIGLAGNAAEWVTDVRGRPTGVLGGSYRDRARDGGRLDGAPKLPAGASNNIPQVGLRIVWTER